MNIDFNTVITSVLALVVAVTLHEYAHALAGYALGDVTAKREGRLSLNPLAHIDPVMTLAMPLMLILLGSPVVFAAAKPVPFNPWALRWGRWGAALVALAGPLTNLTLAVVFGLSMNLVSLSSPVAGLLLTMTVINAGLFVFNMIPFPPLDGSRVLYAAVPSLRDVLDRIESMGMIIMFVALFLGYSLISPVISGAVLGIVKLVVPAGILP
jgi:Zn-dependent protease